MNVNKDCSFVELKTLTILVAEDTKYKYQDRQRREQYIRNRGSTTIIHATYKGLSNGTVGPLLPETLSQKLSYPLGIVVKANPEERYEEPRTDARLNNAPNFLLITYSLTREDTTTDGWVSFMTRLTLLSPLPPYLRLSQFLYPRSLGPLH